MTTDSEMREALKALLACASAVELLDATLSTEHDRRIFRDLRAARDVARAALYPRKEALR